MRDFQTGDRVVLVGHGGFPDGITGTVTPPLRSIVDLCPPGEWEGPRRTHYSMTGRHVSYFVEFDERHDDGSGDGPYRGSEVLRKYLWSLEEQ